jgi:type II secretory pathway pseudopilin PulG
VNTNNFAMLRSARSRRGLTVVELLVAVAIASLVLTGLFVITNTTSRTFRVQNDMSTAMDRMNFAMDLVKMDLRRAAYLGVPNSNVGLYPNFTRVCPSANIAAIAPAGLHGLRALNGAASYQPGTEAVYDGGAPDTFLLLGAYRSTRRYPVNLLQDGTASVRIFSMGQPTALLQDEFTGSVLAVTSNLGGMRFLRAETGANVVTATPGLGDRVDVDLTDALSDPGGEDDICRFAGLARDNLEVAPLHFVRYDVRNDTNERTSVLVREELDHAGTVIRSFVVARNIVDFQVWFDATTSTFGTQPVLSNDGEAAGSSVFDDDGTAPWFWINGFGSAQPERVRYGYIQISTRLETPIPSLTDEGTGTGVRNSVAIFEPTADGSGWVATGDRTRVMTIRSEVELDNFTLADL